MATYTRPSDHPVNHPVLTGVLAQIVAEESFAEGRREAAFPCLLRYSDAGKCLRAIALESLLPLTQDFGNVDVAGEYRMWLGKLIHEKVQGAIVARHGGEIEVASHMGTSSDGEALAAGHADWVGVMEGTDLGRVAYELKTEGAFGFDRSVGLNRKAYQRTTPHGPKASAKIQGALNAVANDCDTLIIGVLSMEAVSIALAEKTGLSNLDRICGEWHYRRAEFFPWAEHELQRAGELDAYLANAVLPPREAVGDEMEVISLTPENVQSDTGVPKQWNCAYCRCRDACVRIGPGAISLDQIGASC